MTIETIILTVIKVAAIILLILHFVFSLIIVRQTQAMIKTLEAKIDSGLFALSVIHLIFSGYVLIWTILFL